MEQRVNLGEFVEELEAMLRVCFEGDVVRTDDGVILRLPDGGNFLLSCRKGD